MALIQMSKNNMPFNIGMSEKCVCVLLRGQSIISYILFITTCVGCSVHDKGQACWSRVERRIWKTKREIITNNFELLTH